MTEETEFDAEPEHFTAEENEVEEPEHFSMEENDSAEPESVFLEEIVGGEPDVSMEEVSFTNEKFIPDMEPLPLQRVYEDGNLAADVAADVKQAESEEMLAEEMSRIGAFSEPEDESELGKTRVLHVIRRAQPEEIQLEEVLQEEDDIEETEEEPELPKMTNHLMIEARTPEKGLEMAIQALKQIQQETGIRNPVAKISAAKLNQRGVLACAPKLAGKDLMVEEAGDLLPKMLKELELLMNQDDSGMRIVLIDNPKQMEMLHAQNPVLAAKFECIGSREPRMTDGFEQNDTFAQEMPAQKPVATAEEV